MSKTLQYDFFKDLLHIDLSEKKTPDKHENMLRGLFKRYGETTKRCSSIEEKQQELENRLYAMEQAYKLKSFTGKFDL